MYEKLYHCIKCVINQAVRSPPLTNRCDIYCV